MKYLFLIAPNLLSGVRLIAGPIFLVWGTLPARGLGLALLVAAAATDLLDGRLARALGTSTMVGGTLDTTADKVFALCLMLKLMAAGVIPVWIFWLLLSQYVILAAAGTAYSFRYHHIPAPEISAHVAAVVAVIVVIVGVVSTARVPATLLSMVLVGANLVHLAIAWLRVAGLRE